MDSSHLPIWSDGDIAVCAKLIKQNEENFTTFLTELAETDLDNLITYTNSKGKEFKFYTRYFNSCSTSWSVSSRTD